MARHWIIALSALCALLLASAHGPAMASAPVLSAVSVAPVSACHEAAGPETAAAKAAKAAAAKVEAAAEPGCCGDGCDAQCALVAAFFATDRAASPGFGPAAVTAGPEAGMPGSRPDGHKRPPRPGA
ncbi:MAG: hypothetical protein ACRC1J_03960 [Sandaracinobacteroides sp.]